MRVLTKATGFALNAAGLGGAVATPPQLNTSRFVLPVRQQLSGNEDDKPSPSLTRASELLPL
jgi:hypothetical protein